MLLQAKCKKKNFLISALTRLRHCGIAALELAQGVPRAQRKKRKNALIYVTYYVHFFLI